MWCGVWRISSYCTNIVLSCELCTVATRVGKIGLIHQRDRQTYDEHIRSVNAAQGTRDSMCMVSFLFLSFFPSFCSSSFFLGWCFKIFAPSFCLLEYILLHTLHAMDRKWSTGHSSGETLHRDGETLCIIFIVKLTN